MTYLLIKQLSKQFSTMKKVIHIIPLTVPMVATLRMEDMRSMEMACWLMQHSFMCLEI